MRDCPQRIKQRGSFDSNDTNPLALLGLNKSVISTAQNATLYQYFLNAELYCVLEFPYMYVLNTPFLNTCMLFPQKYDILIHT